MLLTKKLIPVVSIKDESGFSLVELVTVMVIIAILVGIAVAIFSDVSERPANEAHYANERTIISAMHMALADHGADAFPGENDKVWHIGSPNSSENDIPCWTKYLQEWPTVPKESEYSGEYVVNLDHSGSSVKVIVGLEE